MERATATLVTSPSGRAGGGGGGSDVEVKYYSNYYLSNLDRDANVLQVFATTHSLLLHTLYYYTLPY